MNRQVSDVGFSYVQKSHYHDSCQPKKGHTLPSVRAPLTDAELKKADVVSQDQIWKQAVENEQKGLQKWENAWGFLTEYDSRGNPVEKTAIPGKFEQHKTGPVPITNSRLYGSRIGTEHGQNMLNLEFQLSKNNKKRKLDSEMICY
ncbi:uncharacterized protein C2orf50-like [Watersipora subatra]|uniref:uncharacterized protein C2orf50-like n=1 Tax=Watersipora subatra TaxID=2589382 RepID=UPI00355C4E3C